MLRKLLTKDKICFVKECEDWEYAIRLCGKPLVDDKYIGEGYIEACIESVKKFGPYIVLAPLFAMPHAKAPEYVNRIGLSYLNIGKPVNVLDNPDRAVKVLIMLAATDNSSHIEILALLGETLSDEIKLEGLINAKCPEDVLKIIG